MQYRRLGRTELIDHFNDNLAATERGRLPDEMLQQIRDRYEQVQTEDAE